jgi:orotidine-5'-phosphate decarboxylase
MFFRCIVCGKRKDSNKEKTRWIKHKSKHDYDQVHTSIHVSCLEEVLRDPSKYKLDILDDCVHIAHVLKKQMEEREETKKYLLEEAKKINMEIFLDKAKGQDIGNETA